MRCLQRVLELNHPLHLRPRADRNFFRHASFITLVFVILSAAKPGPPTALLLGWDGSLSLCNPAAPHPPCCLRALRVKKDFQPTATIPYFSFKKTRSDFGNAAASSCHVSTKHRSRNPKALMAL
jgi:hypothetical protein